MRKVRTVGNNVVKLCSILAICSNMTAHNVSRRSRGGRALARYTSGDGTEPGSPPAPPPSVVPGGGSSVTSVSHSD